MTRLFYPMFIYLFIVIVLQNVSDRGSPRVPFLYLHIAIAPWGRSWSGFLLTVFEFRLVPLLDVIQA